MPEKLTPENLQYHIESEGASWRKFQSFMDDRRKGITVSINYIRKKLNKDRVYSTPTVTKWVSVYEQGIGASPKL